MSSTVWLLIPFWLCWGSFLNVLAYRLVRGQSVVRPRSACPVCHHTLAWYDLIPVFSWLLLRGRCRYCQVRISFLYPLIELLTAITMTILVACMPLPYSIAYCIFFSALLVIIHSDSATMLISQYVTVFLIPFAFLFAAVGWLPIPLWASVVGAVGGYAFLKIMAALFWYITGKKGMGEGDSELLAMIGAFIGPIGCWLTLLGASVSGSIVGIIFIMATKSNRSIKIPFGPFMAISAIIIVLGISCRLIG